MSDFVRGLVALTALIVGGWISPAAVFAQAETRSAEGIPDTEPVEGSDADAAPAAEAAQVREESRADDAAPGEADPRDGGADAETKADLERLRRLLRDRPAQEAPAENPLSRAIRGMRSAHERIAASDTSGETRAIQQQVIEDLAALIELSEQPPPPQPPQENPPPDQSPDEQPAERPSERPSESQEGESESESEQQGTQQQQQQSDQARESADRAREADAREAELRRRQNLVDGVWGHLPPSVRNKILSGTGDEYLHDYEHLARRYFEALAEEGARER